MNKIILPVLVTAVVVGGGAFYGGMQYEKAKAPAPSAQFAAFQGANSTRGTRTGAAGAAGAFQNRNGAGGFTTGTITAKDATSLTLSLRDGGSKNIFYTTSTSIEKMASGTDADLADGTQVSIIGTANSDGSIVASSIQIRPAMPPQGNIPPAAQ